MAPQVGMSWARKIDTQEESNRIDKVKPKTHWLEKHQNLFDLVF